MALETFEFPDGSRYELDLSNPEHKAWMVKKAGGGGKSVQPSAPAPSFLERMSTPFVGPPEEAKPNIAAPEVLRQLGLTARAGAKGLSSLPGLLVDPITGVINAAAGTKIPTTVSAMDQAATAVGLPEPRGGTERVVQDATAALAGTGGTLKGAELAGEAAGPVAKGVLEQVQQAPVMQMIASLLSSGAAGSVREGGGGPIAQGAAGIAAGLSPNLVTAAAVPTARLAGKLTEPFSQSGRDTVKARLIRDVSGDKIDDIAFALKTANPKVQGMTYDAPLAAEPAGSTEFSALGRTLQKRFNPTALADLETGNADARTSAVRKIAGSLKDREWAEDLRSSTANMTYGGAYQNKIPANPELARLFQNPFLRKAWEEAGDLNAAQRLNIKKDLTKMLQNTKLSLDKMIAGQAATTLGDAEKREAVRAQQALVGWIEKNNPAYKVAREAFAEQSRPINRMQVGKTLEEKLTAPLDEAERAGVFAQAMRDAPRTLKTSTGNSRYEDIAQVLLPRQVHSLEGVQAELARNRSVQQQASRGQGAVREAVASAFEPVEPPSFLHRGITLLRSLLERSQRGTSKRTLQELAGDMQSPEKISELLKNFPKEDQPAVMAVLKQLATGSALGTGVGLAAQE